MSKNLKSIPKFRSEVEEQHSGKPSDSSDHIDWSKAERVRLPNLKPSTTSISLRLPVSLLDRIKVAANKRDVPYQSLIKTWLAERAETADRHVGVAVIVSPFRSRAPGKETWGHPIAAVHKTTRRARPTAVRSCRLKSGWLELAQPENPSAPRRRLSTQPRRLQPAPAHTPSVPRRVGALQGVCGGPTSMPGGVR